MYGEFSLLGISLLMYFYNQAKEIEEEREKERAYQTQKRDLEQAHIRYLHQTQRSLDQVRLQARQDTYRNTFIMIALLAMVVGFMLIISRRWWARGSISKNGDQAESSIADYSENPVALERAYSERSHIGSEVVQRQLASHTVVQKRGNGPSHSSQTTYGSLDSTRVDEDITNQTCGTRHEEINISLPAAVSPLSEDTRLAEVAPVYQRANTRPHDDEATGDVYYTNGTRILANNDSSRHHEFNSATASQTVQQDLPRIASDQPSVGSQMFQDVSESLVMVGRGGGTSDYPSFGGVFSAGPLMNRQASISQRSLAPINMVRGFVFGIAWLIKFIGEWYLGWCAFSFSHISTARKATWSDLWRTREFSKF